MTLKQTVIKRLLTFHQSRNAQSQSFQHFYRRHDLPNQVNQAITASMLVMIDNYDSFTYNLVHYFQELGAEIRVFRNDALTVEECLALKPSGLVISPGPGSPDQAGVTLDMIAALQNTTPIFGVCLGHQAIGQYFGARVIRGHAPIHGKTSQIHHNEQGILADIPSPYTATRYHSLILDPASIPDTLDITARSDDDTIMALQHKTLPIFGVQYHPESIASEYGHKLLGNFMKICNIRPNSLPNKDTTS